MWNLWLTSQRRTVKLLLFTCVQRPHPHFSMPIIRILIISPIFYLYDFIPLSILPKKKKTKIITHEFEQILGDLAIVVLVTKMRSFKFAMLLLSLWVITLLSLTKTESAPMKHGCVSGLGYGCGCGCGTRQFLKKVGAGAAGLGD